MAPLDSHTYRRGLRRAINEEIERRSEREFGKVTAPTTSNHRRRLVGALTILLTDLTRISLIASICKDAQMLNPAIVWL